MRLLGAVIVAAGAVLVAGGVAPAGPQKPGDKEKLMRPDLTSKEWKRQPSGLETWDVKEGTGDAVKPGGRVKVHYTGWLTDDKGTVFDSSVTRGEPIEFPLTGVIKGWQEGIPGMKVGGVRRLKIPADLAYGKRGAGGAIPPDATLVFEVELLEIK